MAFWTDAQRQDPKRAYRFKLTITGMAPGGKLIWYAKKVTKPKFSITETMHTYLNHKFYYPGRLEWQEVIATLVDPVEPNVTGDLMGMVQAAGYVIPSNPNGLTSIDKRSFVNQVQRITIDQIDSIGTVQESWHLNNAWIKDITLSDLDYEADELSTVDVTFRYDWADLDNSIFIPS